MRTYRLGITDGLSTLFVVLLLASCGGGGGGGGGSDALVYAGNTSPAVVTTTNASTLTANVIGGNDAASIIAGVSAESSNAAPDQGGGFADVSRRLSRDFRDIALRLKPMGSTQQAAVVQIDDTQPCDFGSGTVRVTGPIDNLTGTGTVTVTFTNCVISGVTLNGQATMRIDAVDLVFGPTDATMSFTRLTLRATGLSVDAGGSLRIQLVIATNTETVTASLVSLDNSTGETGKTENLVSVSVFDDIAAPTSFTENLSGRVFDQVHGYVDITTPTLLVFDALDQLFPTSGQMVMTGAVAGTGKRAIRATALLAPPAALPATLASLELDLDGDSNYEINARLKWTDLSGAVGADLGDSDGDGMHNSWETVNGLNPADLSDGAGDKDNDVSTNLSEYLAGTDPSDPFSHP